MHKSDANTSLTQVMHGRAGRTHNAHCPSDDRRERLLGAGTEAVSAPARKMEGGLVHDRGASRSVQVVASPTIAS